MVLGVLACILLINRRIIFRKFTKILAKVKISIVYLRTYLNT